MILMSLTATPMTMSVLFFTSANVCILSERPPSPLSWLEEEDAALGLSWEPTPTSPHRLLFNMLLAGK